MGAQEAHEEMDMLLKTIQIRENVKGQISLRQFARNQRKHSTSRLTSARNTEKMTQKVTAILTTVCEAVGRLEQGN